MHQHWMNITHAYVHASRALSPVTLWRGGPKRELVPLALTLALMVAVAASLYRVALPIWPVVCILSVAVLMLLCFSAMDRIAARRYPHEYARYSISRQPFSKRLDFLCYALFRQRMTEEGYTVAQLKAIADYSETLGPLPKPFQINQHFLTLALSSVLIGLFINYLQGTADWAERGLVYIWAVASIAVVVTLVLDGIRTAQSREIRVRRYLKRAWIELEYERMSEVEVGERDAEVVSPRWQR
ncbi:MAG TPA: hypothetical protein VJS90_01335 [Pseudomonas sp.]|uniref:hypothetical protein n=1 Tax=Pseudomonas sp. TaxID=306 RepID=UPI002B483E13|nr:hypothetical protein [Pseudomonas sp.]HKS11658.1 hypothetical protein [Pseudomonas sp.]